ncbi:MAG: transposase [Deltaproteobacteria bacterium]|nr:transposase [Deltaproteobacteria bacterium]
MSNIRYTQEFKEEAIRLIRNRAESVISLSKRLCATTNTLYRWDKESKIELI